METVELLEKLASIEEESLGKAIAEDILSMAKVKMAAHNVDGMLQKISCGSYSKVKSKSKTTTKSMD